MSFRLVWALLPGVAFAQSVTYGPLISNISHSTARVTFITDSNPQTSEVVYTRDDGYSNVVSALRNGSTPYTSSALLVGLTPGTTYHLKARLNGSLYSNEVVFTTAPEPAIHPEPPRPPAAADVSMPSGSYGDSSALQVQSDCSNLPDVLKAVAQLSGDLNYEVVIPAGTECRGRFTFPPRPNHTGWVVVRSSAVSTAAFPPEGTRWTPDWQGSTARFVTNVLPVSQWGNVGALKNLPCEQTIGEGGYAWAPELGPGFFSLFRCSNNIHPYSGPNAITAITGHITATVTAPGHKLNPGDVVAISANGYVYPGQYGVISVSGDNFVVRSAARMSGAQFNSALNPVFTRNEYWRQIPYTQGTSLPAACNVWDWFINTDTGGYYWCTAPNQWRQFRFEGPLWDDQAALVVPATAQKYRFIGLEVTPEKLAEPFPPGWDKPANGSQTQGVVRLLVGSHGNHVVWDRCYLHGHPFPQRLGAALWLTGENVGFVNSYLDEAAWWRGSGYSQVEGTFGIYHQDGGVALIDNNYMAVAGISYFVPNSAYTDVNMVHDVTFSRNTMRVYPKWRNGDPENNGYIYTNRNSWELKLGTRFKVEGNDFYYEYSGLTAGQFLLLTPRCSSLPAATPLTSITDGVVQLGKAVPYTAGDVVFVNGTNSSYDGLWELAEAGCPDHCGQFKLLNAPSGAASGGTMALRASARGISDVLMQYNTFSQGTDILRVTGTTGCGNMQLPATQRIALSNNVSNDMNFRSFADGGRVDKGGTFSGGDFGARAVYNLGWLEDLSVTGNKFILNRGKMPVFLWSDLVSEGLLFSNNFYTFNDTTAFRSVFAAGATGTAALNKSYVRDGAPNWIFVNNVICCGLGEFARDYPPSTEWPNSFGEVAKNKSHKPAKAALYASLRPFLPVSAFKKNAEAPEVEGTPDRVPELDELATRQGRVQDVSVSDIAGESAVVRYFAPDPKACFVQYGTSPSARSGKRVGDGGGDRRREVRLTGLPTQALVYYRVLCAVPSAPHTFQTK